MIAHGGLAEEPAAQPRPFDLLSFSLIRDGLPRTVLRLQAQDDSTYELHVQKGSASNPTMQFTRVLPVETAQRLKDALQELGVFGWDDAPRIDCGSSAMRWNLRIVFKEGVFAQEFKGGSDVPPAFDGMLEEFYRIDFPRPPEKAGVGSSSLGLGADSLVGLESALEGAGVDLSQLGEVFGESGLFGADALGGDMAALLAEARTNPRIFEQRMKDEFKHLPREQQQSLLDMLASTGMASRAWWERFFGLY